MPAPLVECVPNFSEGRNSATLDALRAAITSVLGVRLLDVQADPSHNRSVFTLVARPAAAAEAAFRRMRVATDRIGLTKHQGEHPRMGATDVVPFVPVRDVTMDECVAVARRLAERAASELGIPIYLYARAATRPERERLPDIGKGRSRGCETGSGGIPLPIRTSGRNASIRPPGRPRSGRGPSWWRSTSILTRGMSESPRTLRNRSARRAAGCRRFRRPGSRWTARPRSR